MLNTLLLLNWIMLGAICCKCLGRPLLIPEKCLAMELAYFLAANATTAMIQKSLDSGGSVEDWKFVNVITLFKKVGRQNNANN